MMRAYPIVGLAMLILIFAFVLLFNPLIDLKKLTLLAPLILLFSISFLRTYLHGHISLASLAFSTLQITTVLAIVTVYNLKIENLMRAGFTYVVLAVFFGTLTFENSLGNNRILDLLGIEVSRANSFLFGNFSYSSMLFGILCGWSFILKRKMFGFVFMIILVLLDSRTAILALPLAFLATRLEYKYLGFIIGIFLLPAIMFIVSFIYVDMNILSYRNLIWATILNGYNPPLKELFIGYGYLGQLTSGLSSLYHTYFLDRGAEQSLLMSPHNSLIQGVLDYGIIGYSFVIYLLWRIITISMNHHLLLFCGIYLLLNGGFEIVLMPPNYISLIVLGILINESQNMKSLSRI